MQKAKILFVVQRYGLEVNGGAEAECRMYAERLVPFYDVEVLTTCAEDYTTWRNTYPAGVTEINGVRVRRFRSEKERHPDFSALCAEVQNPEAVNEEMEQRWIDAQGPFCPKLLQYLAEHAEEYKAVLFMTYLYYTACRGLLAPFHTPKILIPTAHDEWPIYLKHYQKVFAAADRFIYNAPAEKTFVEQHFPAAAGKPSVIVGAGVEAPAGELPDIRERFDLKAPYICYCGRIDEAKGCKALFEYFNFYKQRHASSLQLVLTGKAAMAIPEREDIVALGFVSDEEKLAVMQGAEAFVLASEFESLSIVVLESLMMGTPVLVNGKCQVLKDHCTLSNAGLYFEDYYTFEASLNYLLSHPDETARMAENGKQYVEENYRWDKIVENIRALIEKNS